MKYTVVKMPVKKIVFILFSILLFQGLTAQDTIQRKSIVTLNVFSVLASQAPRWEVGYIRNISKRVWLGVELGYGNHDITINDVSGRDRLNDDYQIFEIRPAVYFDLRPQKKLKHLASFELYFIHHTDTFERSSYYAPSEFMSYKYDIADYKRIKYGFNLNYNLLYNFGSRISLMQTIGLGLRIRDVSFTNVVNKTEDPYNDDNESFIFPVIDKYLNTTGTASAFNFNVDLKLLYKFK